MPFPSGVQLVTVTAGASGYHAPDGTPYTGTIRFTPTVSRIASAQYGVITLGPVNATLSASGMFTETLLATDAAGFSPSGWTYRVDEEFTGLPSRSYNISLPAGAPTVDLPSLAPVSSTSGTVTSPAVLSVNGKTGVVTGLLDAANNLSDVTSAATARTNLGLGGAAVLNVGASAGTVAAGNDARLSDARTPLAHAASHASGGSDPVTIAQSQVTGLTTALASKADLAGATFTSDVSVTGADFTVSGTGKAYRFRRGGSALDTEAGGQDWFISTFPNADFSGTQNNYLRLEAGAAILHVTAEARFDATAFGARVHTLDGPGNKVGFYGATPAAKPTVTGAKGGNTALGSLLTALATLGLITDSTTA